MNADTPVTRYSSLTIALHWLTLVLMVAVYASIELRELFPKGSDPREALKALHFMLGLLVLGLVVPRMVARLRQATPPITPAPAAWQQQLAHAAHGLLYLFMLAMPIAGWLLLSAAGKPIPFFGLELPALIGPDKALAGTIKEIHETVGTLGYWLIGLHAGAAIFHHHVQHDDTLLRMLPRRG